MAEHYDFYKNPPSQKAPKKVRLHPRVVTHNTTTPQALASLVQSRCSASTADFALVLDLLRSVFRSLCGLRQTTAAKDCKY